MNYSADIFEVLLKWHKRLCTEVVYLIPLCDLKFKLMYIDIILIRRRSRGEGNAFPYTLDNKPAR